MRDGLLLIRADILSFTETTLRTKGILRLGGPVGAGRVLLPAIGMEPADEDGAGCTAIPVGDAVVICTALTHLGACGAAVAKAELRSQNMAFALKSMPALMVGHAEAIVGLAERILSNVHKFFDKG